MCADNDVRLFGRRGRRSVCVSRGDGVLPAVVVEEGKRAGFFAPVARAEGDAYTEGRAEALELKVMLFGKDLGRCHEGGLEAGVHGEQHGGEGDERFTRANVSV